MKISSKNLDNFRLVQEWMHGGLFWLGVSSSHYTKNSSHGIYKVWEDDDQTIEQSNFLQLLFRKILSGEYGELYESLNPPKILTFFRNYLNERMNVGAEMSIRKHLEYKQL